ncbi:hypothetical protein [Streptomyces sp. PT12]|uniref:hypothetical protein n=1 Tax=Streptomyces sp. PT12 TaxID=1510197 RepID=UPI000DE4028B|nr:hypothetical protein [Streptomyces sp. PT12]RBM12659.1 hypothetical protein DEH69_19605 [Streptomyces sp. PT12]
MGEWGVALIAAGSALAGSLVTGWFSRAAGSRQAEAARHAGDRQADALLETVRMTLGEQRDARVQDVRRQTYVRFLEAAEGAILARRTGEGQASARAALHQALAAVDLEGPDAVAAAARGFVSGLRADEAPGDLGRARETFAEAARAALHI